MASIKLDNGEEIELSQETTDRLRKELIRGDENQLKVDRFRAAKEYDCVRIALTDFRDTVWDGNDGGADASHLLMFSEVKKIIEGLTKMIGD